MPVFETPSDDAASHPLLDWRRQAALFLPALLAAIAVDFLAHAGILARFYVGGSPFLLPPAEAFIRIPAGYLSIALLVAYLTMLMSRLGVCGIAPGLVAGFVTGGTFGLSLSLGLWSISTADPDLLAGWTIVYAAELAVAGALIGMGFAGARLRNLWLLAGLFALGAIIATVVMQNTGISPARLVQSAGPAPLSHYAAAG